MSDAAIYFLNPSPEGGGWSAKPTGWGMHQLNPTRPLAEPVIGPRFARARWLASTLRLQGRDGAEK